MAKWPKFAVVHGSSLVPIRTDASYAYDLSFSSMRKWNTATPGDAFEGLKIHETYMTPKAIQILALLWTNVLRHFSSHYAFAVPRLAELLCNYIRAEWAWQIETETRCPKWKSVCRLQMELVKIMKSSLKLLHKPTARLRMPSILFRCRQKS